MSNNVKISAIEPEDVEGAKLTNAEFREAMTLLNASLDDMAWHIGVARRNIAHYRKDMAVPLSIAMATRYLLHRAGRELGATEPRINRMPAADQGKRGGLRRSSFLDQRNLPG